MTKVFIDGSAGTTGLRIYERLGERKDLELLILKGDKRKDLKAREDALNTADIAFLCLPDTAAKEAVTLIKNNKTVVIDTSTAHRTADGWVYGFPEITGQRERIEKSTRIANPGCHASGFISLIKPLTEHGIIPKDAILSAFSLTGYSGGGKAMIADYELQENKEKLQAPRSYGLSQTHKHLPEMSKICGLEKLPLFTPVVSSYYSGMEVVITLAREQINGTIDDIKNTYKSYYTGMLIKYRENTDENGFLSASAFAGRDDMEVGVFGNSDRIMLVSRFDNLGKGASGAAIQNMNIVLGIDETTGLNIGE